jgi:hypothetical protein
MINGLLRKRLFTILIPSCPSTECDGVIGCQITSAWATRGSPNRSSGTAFERPRTRWWNRPGMLWRSGAKNGPGFGPYDQDNVMSSPRAKAA